MPEIASLSAPGANKRIRWQRIRIWTWQPSKGKEVTYHCYQLPKSRRSTSHRSRPLKSFYGVPNAPVHNAATPVASALAARCEISASSQTHGRYPRRYRSSSISRSVRSYVRISMVPISAVYSCLYSPFLDYHSNRWPTTMATVDTTALLGLSQTTLDYW